MSLSEFPDYVDPDDDHSLRLIYVLAGPLRYMSTSFPVAILLLLVCLWLTVISQLFGVLFWVALPLLDVVWHRLSAAGSRVAAAVFTLATLAALTLLTSFVVVPAVAPRFGRVPLPCSSDGDAALRPQSKLACLLMRNYTTPAARAKLERIAAELAKETPGSVVYYLDAGFPFWKDFPMLPHLSHSDGRKIDLAFAYAREQAPAAPRSPVGYWAYEPPIEGEEQPCAGGKASRLRWDMDMLQARLDSTIVMDLNRTQALILKLLADEQAPKVRRLLIEPHLKTRLQLTDERVRFQGCRAARHDDHFHVEL